MDSHAATRLIGRTPELAALDAFLGAPWPRALLVEGPAGIGKTSLIAALLPEATSRGAVVLVAEGTQAEAGIPHATLTALFPDDRVTALLPALSPPRRRSLEIALRRVDPTPGGSLDPAALGLAVLDGLRRSAGGRPILLVVDDLQWCDVASATALAYALRRAGELPIGVLAGVRSGVDAAPVEIVVAALAADRVDRMPVGSLSVGAIGRLLEERTGTKRSRSTSVRIAEAALGNPLLALELARALDAGGRIPGAAEPLAVPASSEPLLAARLAGLSPAAEDVVLAVALGGARSADDLARVIGSAVAEAVDETLRAGLLEVTADGVRLAHPLVGAAAVGRAGEGRQRAIHRALAAVTSDPVASARHLALATSDPDDVVAAVCDVAATDAERHGAPGPAADLVELALGLTGPGSAVARLARLGRAASLRRGRRRRRRGAATPRRCRRRLA